jgi:hypothetical protein
MEAKSGIAGLKLSRTNTHHGILYLVPAARPFEQQVFRPDFNELDFFHIFS